MRPFLVPLIVIFCGQIAVSQEPPTTPRPSFGQYSLLTVEKARQTLEDNRAKIEQIQKTEDAAAKAKTPPAPEVARKNEEQKQALSTDSNALADMFPKDSGVQAAAARLATQTGDYPKALERAEKAVAADPENADALKARAIANFASGRYPEAAADAQAVLKKNPDDLAATGVLNLSKPRTAASTGGIPAPLATPAEVRLLVSQAASALTRPAGFTESVGRTGQAETALRLRDYEAMHRQATAAIAQMPSNPKAYMQRAFASLFLKKPADALKDANVGLALKPDAAALLALRAAANNQLGKPKDALADAQKAVALDPKDPFAWVQKGTARKLLGELPEKYLEDLKKASELNPAFSSYYTEALAELGRAPKTPGAPSTPAAPGARNFSEELAPHFPTFIFIAILLAVSVPVYLAWRRTDNSEIMDVQVTGHAEEHPAPPKPEQPATPPATPPAKDGLIGGHFKLGKLIGRGGMGEVYKAVDTRLDRPVAIKRLHEHYQTSVKELERFMAEAKTVAALKHPAIVQIHDVFVENGEVHLVFEMVDGENILQMIDRSAYRRLEPSEMLRILRPVCEALDYAHSKGVIHRDLKSSNIMVEHGRVKIMDFGLARRTSSPSVQTQSQTAMGTPAYMAPEQHGGELSRASDLYALGVCLFEMATGELPFTGKDPYLAKVKGKIAAHPPALEPFFKKALAILPDARFRNATELYAAFEAAISGA